MKYSTISETNVRDRYLDDIRIHQLHENFNTNNMNPRKQSERSNLLMIHNSRDFENYPYLDVQNENSSRQNSIRFTNDLPLFDHSVRY